MAESFNVIVLGTGGVGCAAMYHLARRGVRVRGIDRFPGGHNCGSSHGVKCESFGKPIFEHSDNLPLLQRAYHLWNELQQTVGEQLYFPV